MGVLRSWQCLNGRCEQTFDDWEANPACPDCGCVRVSWIPGGGHVAGTAKAADAELRALADNFGMTDMNSAQRDQRAKPGLPSAPPIDRHAPSVSFAPGFSSPLVRDQQGQPVATCLPSTSNVNFKTRVGTGTALAPSKAYPRIAANTVIQASHKG